MRKIYLALLTILLFGSSLFAQSSLNQAQIMQLCIDLPVFEQYGQLTSDENVVKIVSQYPIEFSNEMIKLVDPSKVVFQTSEMVKVNKVQAYFAFRFFEVGHNSASATVNYFYDYDLDSESYKMVAVNVSLKKSDKMWSVEDLILNEMSR
ncbi:hypothetical protein [Sunxiuqinia indica]|uniref:hypothetical protein n=1 Tax=Sunxiuqinia indica TaxID=2692584 RepID=UPI0013581644|nr:hypothetical protein [Sunxiuqinia indica]